MCSTPGEFAAIVRDRDRLREWLASAEVFSDPWRTADLTGSFPRFSWDAFERQVIDLLPSAEGRTVAHHVCVASRKLSDFKPSGLLLAEVLGLVSAVLGPARDDNEA